MKLGGSQSLVQSDAGQKIQSSTAGVVRHGCRVIVSAFKICLGGGWHGRARSARGRSGRGGAGGVQKTVEILQVPFVVVSQIQFIDRVCPSSCEQRQVSTGVAVLGQGC